MKFLIHFALFLLFASTTFAGSLVDQKLSLSFSSTSTFYSCSLAENKAEELLTALGAQDIKMYCHGGLESGSYPYGVLIRAEFKTANSQGIAEDDLVWKEVLIEGRDRCDLITRFMAQILNKLEHRDLESKTSCFDSRGRYFYKLLVLE